MWVIEESVRTDDHDGELDALLRLGSSAPGKRHD